MPTPDILTSNVEGFQFVCISNEQSQLALTLEYNALNKKNVCWTANNLIEVNIFIFIFYFKNFLFDDNVKESTKDGMLVPYVFFFETGGNAMNVGEACTVAPQLVRAPINEYLFILKK